MRCVDKGAVPANEDGTPSQFADYRDAATHLKTRIGRYCSYCERFVPVSLAVEHKRPKHLHPALERDWDNFLLACANCNSHKLASDPGDHAVLWPDRDDTFAALTYLPTGKIVPTDGLIEAMSQAAAALLTLVGLDRSPKAASNADHRWPDRMETWSVARQSRDDLLALDTPEMRACIINTATSRGCFSVWMAAFHDDPAMRAALINAFPGTVLRGPSAMAN